MFLWNAIKNTLRLENLLQRTRDSNRERNKNVISQWTQELHQFSTECLTHMLFRNCYESLFNGTHNEVKEIKHLSNDIKTVRAGWNKELIKMSRIFYDFNFDWQKPFEKRTFFLLTFPWKKFGRINKCEELIFHKTVQKYFFSGFSFRIIQKKLCLS